MIYAKMSTQVRIKNLLFFCIATGAIWATNAVALDLDKHPRLKRAVVPLINEGLYTSLELDKIFAGVRLREEVVKKKANAAEKKLTWRGDGNRPGGYRGIFLKPERINQGVEFWLQYEDELNRASSIYGVEPEIICAIIGVETKFGRIKGKDRVIESISTLANAGSKLQIRQLPEFLRLVKQGHLSLDSVGSYAGAMGIPQFISTSYSAYGVDFTGDGRVDLINDPVDAIGSVANYFKEHGWKKGAPVAYPIQPKSTKLDAMASRKRKTISTVNVIKKQANGIPSSLSLNTPATVVRLLGKDDVPEYFLGLKNLYVITKYNHSVLYAMAVRDLSRAIKDSYLSRQNYSS
ncbi:MAG: lytic murein transglycosylase [Arenicella sp.]